MTTTENMGNGMPPRALHTEVADRLREMIIRGELSQGERLNERLLTERFQISRTPLREAIKTLSSEGFVDLRPNRGAIVTTITRADAEDMFQVVSALEALAGQLACARGTDEEFARIREMHQEMRLCHARRDLDAYFALNQRIHEAIVECARNQALARIYRMLAVRIRRPRYIANFSAQRWDDAMREHEEILEALLRRDGHSTKSLLATHLNNKLAVIEEWLEESSQD